AKLRVLVRPVTWGEDIEPPVVEVIAGGETTLIGSYRSLMTPPVAELPKALREVMRYTLADATSSCETLPVFIRPRTPTSPVLTSSSRTLSKRLAVVLPSGADLGLESLFFSSPRRIPAAAQAVT